MVRKMIVPAGLAAVLGLFASAAVADGEKEAAKTLRGAEDRVEFLDRTVDLTRRGPARVHRRSHHRAFHHRHQTRHAHYRHNRPWDGRYGLHPRRHFYITGVSSYGPTGPVNVATVAYRTYVYYTPTYPSVSYGYPPYAHLYDLAPGPVYNKPCFC